ncbi:hypothetical protein J3998_03720 [Thiomicrorhabdus sp. 6S2-11]|uniref:Uncharacterized protein n=1 Tax=Thiomicrorhabdus marina TaxID=2818442 RepID=A0ABS3Q309_9GAMM|nr:hypothetical protein [Thiomicrorhabdus marina]MBO1926676.1 hypothetical protein [Thiomicrorhabdus marina]
MRPDTPPPVEQLERMLTYIPRGIDREQKDTLFSCISRIYGRGAHLVVFYWIDDRDFSEVEFTDYVLNRPQPVTRADFMQFVAMAKANGWEQIKPKDNPEKTIIVTKRLLGLKKYENLSHGAKALLWELINQYDGSNNGELTATHKELKGRGWKSKNTIKKHLDELVYSGLAFCVKSTRYGEPNNYGLTWVDRQQRAI